MRSRFRQVFSVFPALLLLTAAVHVGAAGRAFAHGAGWSQENAFAVVLSLQYADQTPMLYCEVQVFSPADSTIAYQKGRSDRNGGFAFKPDCAGMWSFSARDSEGHQSTGEVEVTEEQLRGAAGAGEARLAQGGAAADGVDPVKVALGLSLIANMGLFFFRRRK